MKLPCEIAVWYCVPMIKSELAKELVKNRGMKQGQVAELLGVTQAAVSQYVSKRRGKGRIKPTKNMLLEIKRFATCQVERNKGKCDPKDVQAFICKMCLMARKEGLLKEFE